MCQIEKNDCQNITNYIVNGSRVAVAKYSSCELIIL